MACATAERARQHGPRKATIISANRVWGHLLVETRIRINKPNARGFDARGIKTI
jgi:hypothetical protein